MKLKYLFELDRVIPIKKGSSYVLPAQPKGTEERGRVHLGTGAQASASERPSKPGFIQKKVYFHTKDHTKDPYFRFVQIILSHQDNPFFPRISSAKVYEDPAGNRFMLIEMEKLFSINNPRLEHMWPHFLEQMGFDQQTIEHIILQYTKYKPWAEEELDEIMRKAFAMPQYRELMRQQTRNPKFREAMEVLEHLFADPQIDVDTHTENLRARLTGTGPQIVLMDPFILELSQRK